MSDVDNSWVVDLEPRIFALVKTRADKKLQAEYPNIFWTLDNAVNAEPKFPTVYMFCTYSENGNDLMNQDINGVYFMVQVEIYVDKKQGLGGARRIASVVLNEFKQLGFSFNDLPFFDGNSEDIKRMIFRCRRVIGQADIIN